MEVYSEGTDFGQETAASRAALASAPGAVPGGAQQSDLLEPPARRPLTGRGDVDVVDRRPLDAEAPAHHTGSPSRPRVREREPEKHATRASRPSTSIPGAASLVLLGTDLAAVLASTCTVLELARLLGHGVQFVQSSTLSAPLLWLLLLPISHRSLGLYPAFGLGGARELKRLTFMASLVFLFVAWGSLSFPELFTIPPAIVLASWAVCIATLPLGRSLIRGFLSRRRWWGEPVVILGAGRLGQTVANKLGWNPDFGLRPLAFLDDDAGLVGTEISGVTVAGPLSEAPQFARQGVRRAIIALPEASSEYLMKILDSHAGAFKSVTVVPDLLEFNSHLVASDDFCGMLGLEVRRKVSTTWCRHLKRCVDMTLTVLGGIFLLPLLAIIAILVKLDSPGPVFFSQRRVGFRAQRFMAWKFRTMVRNADEVLQDYLHRDARFRQEWCLGQKVQNDPRITRVGKFLRKLSLDELPQFWNVLRGDMSLIGPRPIVQNEIEKYGDEFFWYSSVCPGLTGLWQVSGRNDTTYDERVTLDSCYVKNWSIWLDLHILIRTLSIIISGKGAY